MGIAGTISSHRGQMTVEAAVAFPALIAIAIIMLNALLFFDACSAFDRQFRLAVTTYGTSPSHGEGPGACLGSVDAAVKESLEGDFLESSVTMSGHAPGWVTYTGELRFTPTLLGRSLSGSVFGVPLPPIVHTASMTVDPYRPGAVV